MTTDQDRIDNAIMEPYKNDLADMTEDQFKEEYRRARDELEEIQPWFEALAVFGRTKGFEAPR